MAEVNRDDQLQQYFDGELSADEAEALRAELERDEALQAKLDGLAHLRSLIREAYEPGSLELPLGGDDAFAAITARLDEEDDSDVAPAAEVTEEPTERPALRVVDGGQKDAPAKPASSPRGMWLGVGGLALAAAAALLIFFLRPTDGTTPTGGDDADGPIAAAEPPPGSEIEQVDLGHSTGAIFQVEDEGALYAVVWISDEKPEHPTAADATDVENEERVQ